MFSPGSRFMTAMSAAADFMLLNLLFLVSCIPVVTIGTAYAALYTVMFRMQSEDDRSAVKIYIEAFRANFRQCFAVWLILLFVGAAVIADLVIFMSMSGSIRYLSVLFAVLLFLLLLVFSCCFPLAARYSNSNRQLLKNSLAVSVGFLPRFTVISALNVVPAVTFLLWPTVFFEAGILWLIIWFSFSVYINSRLLKRVFSSLENSGSNNKEESI